MQYKVVVEEGGVVNEVFDFSGFMGTVESKIEYILEPDVEGSDRALIDFDDLTNRTTTQQWCNGVRSARAFGGPKLCSHVPCIKWQPVSIINLF